MDAFIEGRSRNMQTIFFKEKDCSTEKKDEPELTKKRKAFAKEVESFVWQFGYNGCPPAAIQNRFGKMGKKHTNAEVILRADFLYHIYEDKGKYYHTDFDITIFD